MDEIHKANAKRKDRGRSEKGAGDSSSAGAEIEFAVSGRVKIEVCVTLNKFDCKLYRFNKDENEWRDAGKGTFCIIQEQDGSEQKQMLMRNTTGTGGLMINAYFYKNMQFTKMGTNGIRFLLVIDNIGSLRGELKMILIKLAPESVDDTNIFAKVRSKIKREIIFESFKSTAVKANAVYWSVFYLSLK
jgi:hypothetical protein